MDIYATFIAFYIFYFTTAAPVTSKQDSPLGKVCEVLSTRRETDGFVSYTVTIKTCSGITPSTFYNVTCDERCRDPVRNKTLSKKYYKSEPIVRIQTFVTRGGDEFSERLHTSCRCVATDKGLRKAKSKHGKGGKKRHDKRRH